MDKLTLLKALEVVKKLSEKHRSKLKTAKHSQQRVVLASSCLATKEVELAIQKLIDKCK
jgi:hypothetical protein